MTISPGADSLVAFLRRVPGVHPSIGSGTGEDGRWWVKFDVTDPLAWRVVQELGHVLNYLSLDERLPTTFLPVSPPPYMNGGPQDFLSWVVESRSADFSGAECAKWLEGRLPNPVDDREQWNLDDEE